MIQKPITIAILLIAIAMVGAFAVRIGTEIQPAQAQVGGGHGGGGGTGGGHHGFSGDDNNQGNDNSGGNQDTGGNSGGN
jgi:hypothetical protein